MKFIHVADTHLRHTHYGRYNLGLDFYLAFRHMVDKAIELSVDFIVLAGDLFNSPDPDPIVISQAFDELARLRDARIPLFTIYGNHELPSYRMGAGWLDFFDNLGLIRLINSLDGPHKTYASRVFDGTSVVVSGLPWTGSATVASMQEFSQKRSISIDSGTFHIVLMHAGLEGVLPGNHHGAFGVNDLQDFILPYADYVALGHVHKPYKFGDQVFNPGSLHACSVAEYKWPDRGFYLVEVDKGARITDYVIHGVPNRCLEQIEIDLSGKSVSSVNEEIAGASKQILESSLVEIKLSGQPEPAFEFAALVLPEAEHVILNKRGVRYTRQEVKAEERTTFQIEAEVMASLLPESMLVLGAQVRNALLGNAGSDTIADMIIGETS